MCETKLACVYILFATSVCVRCEYWERIWPLDDNDGGSGDYHGVKNRYNQGLPIDSVLPSNCDIEKKKALTEIKSEIQNLQQLMFGLRHKLDPDFKPPPPPMCPPGFTYLTSAKTCYKVVYESHDWYSAGKKCQELHRGSHLAAITSATQNKVLKPFLASELSKNVGNTACSVTKDWSYGRDAFWTSAQRILEKDCKSPFVWKPTIDKQLPLEFTNWWKGEPNCGRYGEDCMLILPKDDFAWVDIWCTAKMCPLCEYKP